MSEEAKTGPDHTHDRIFLVVVDDSNEWRCALRFACRRAQHTEGRIALLHVSKRAEFQHWMAVAEAMREEEREEAEARLNAVAGDVYQLTGRLPVIYLREGSAEEELLKLIEEEPAISILVLAARSTGDGPGPLISYLTHRGVGRLTIPVTIVPDTLSLDEIDVLA